MNASKLEEFYSQYQEVFQHARAQRIRFRKSKQKRAYTHWNGVLQGMEKTIQLLESFAGSMPMQAQQQPPNKGQQVDL